jgi:hypothetical protein
LTQIRNRPLNSTTYHSRRRAAAQTRLPDWVWGAGLGVIALFFIAVFFLVSGVLGGGGGGSQCDDPLAPLGSSEISAEAFQEEDAALGRVIGFLQSGDRVAAEAAFYGPVHNFTHNADPPLREQDEELAKELCEAVLVLEESFITGTTPDVATDTQRVRDLLRDAAVALGYPRPG